MARTKKVSTVSVLNWMGTIILTSIPGVNAIFVILTLIFAKSPSKRNYAWALLILTALIVAGAAALLAVFPEEAALLAEVLEAYAAGSPPRGLCPLGSPARETEFLWTLPAGILLNYSLRLDAAARWSRLASGVLGGGHISWIPRQRN